MDLNLLRLGQGLHRFCNEFDIHVLSFNLTSSAPVMLNLVNLIMFGEV